MDTLIMIVGIIGVMIALRLALAAIDWLERLGEDDPIKAPSEWWTDRDDDSY